MRTRKQKLILLAKIVGFAFVLALILMIVFRDTLLHEALDVVAKKMERDYDSQFSVKKAGFTGLTEVELEEIVLVPHKKDTLFRIQHIKTGVSFWHLFTGTIRLQSLKMDNGFVQLVKNEQGRNFDAFLRKKDTADTGEKPNYAKLVYRILNRGLNLIPTDMHLENLALRMNDMGRLTVLDLRSLSLENKELESAIAVRTNTFQQRWRIKGFADPRNKQTDLRFFNIDTGRIKVPYLDERFGLTSSFDSIRLNVSRIDMDGGELHVDGFTSISNLTINHPKIAHKDVVIEKARFDYNFLFGEHFVAIDSSSTAQLNQLVCHPYLSYNNETDKIYTLKVDIPKMKAQDFINSLPQGLFTHFVGMEATGSFDYRLNFSFNKNKPGTVILESNLNKYGLSITKYGEANLNKLNGEFTYRAIINNTPQRPVFVGASNPTYTPLNQISPYLRKCVLTTEDPSFFSHKGFIKEAFKQSIVKNIRTRKFSRGGSTISMQLIKNVFLTREKTLSRKLEEILLVYILENNRIVSKERMLEVYFNIIEWGPNIYGIGEASAFYFQKTPAELSLNECLFLANIIPSPRKFMYQFDAEGNLKAFTRSRDKQLKNIMMRRGLIAPDDTIGQQPVHVNGNARSFLKIIEQNPAVQDSTSIEEFEF